MVTFYVLFKDFKKHYYVRSMFVFDVYIHYDIEDIYLKIQNYILHVNIVCSNLANMLVNYVRHIIHGM